MRRQFRAVPGKGIVASTLIRHDIFASDGGRTTLIASIQRGTDSKTNGTNYYYVFPQRTGDIAANEIWDKLKVSKNLGATHFPSEDAACEWIVDNICNDYNVNVDVGGLRLTPTK
jgi:hypothetical protein